MHIFTELFADAPHVLQILTLFQVGFTIWMMVDAYHRRVEYFWYWVICIFQPVGAWAYFFIFKFRGLSLSRMRPAVSWERKQSLEELRFHVERTPTVANRFALAERLMEKGAHAEAAGFLEAILTIEPDYGPVLHALAECRLATNHAEQAMVPLERLIQRDPRWSHYQAWRTLVDVHVARGRPDEALIACREYAKRQPTLENRCLLAEHLLGNGKPAEAVEVLKEALDEYQFAPWSARWHDGRWARAARRLLTAAEKNGQRSVAGPGAVDHRR